MFKVGDKVKCVQLINGHGGLVVGRIYCIEACYHIPSGPLYAVTVSYEGVSHGWGGLIPEQFALIPKAPKRNLPSWF